MKQRIILAAIFFFILSIFLEAQVRYGLKAGANITNITIVNRESKSRAGLQAGILALVPLDSDSDMLFFQPEIIFSTQGEFYYTGGKDYKVFLNYIDVPLMLKVYFSEAESEFFAEFGPHLGFKITEKIDKLESSAMTFNTFDFALGLGLGYSFNREFEIYGRYTYGFTDVVKNDLSDDKNHTSILNFGLSYIFY